MSNKWMKNLLGLLAVGAVVGGAITYFTKKKDCCNCEDEFADDFEDEDFDLDEDLKDPAEREYVSLTPEAKENAEEETKSGLESETEANAGETDNTEKTEEKTE